MEPSTASNKRQREQQQQQQQMTIGHRDNAFSSTQAKSNASSRPNISKIRRTCGSVRGPVEVMELATMGARSPIRFVERSPTSLNSNGNRNKVYFPSDIVYVGGQQRPRMPPRQGFSDERRVPPGFRTPIPAFSSPNNNGNKRSCASRAASKSWYHRISTPPLDAVCFTLMGVSVWLQQPGVDPWAVSQALVDSSVDLRTRNARGMTPLHLACQAGQVDVARVLLLAGADPHARDRRSRCPLHLAATTGSEALVAALLASGADPQKASDSGTTPLHNAALHGHVGVLRALLLAGAKADAADKNTFSPLYLAAQNGHTEVVVDLLTAAGASATRTTRGFTPLHVAARCGHLSVLRVLLDSGVPVDCVSTQASITPLHLAARFSRVECVQELLKRGADPNRENQRGSTPFDLVGTLPPLSSAASEETWASCGESCGLGGNDVGCAAVNNGGADRFSAERRVQDAKRVRQILLRAQAWLRKRNAVLVCETLRGRWGFGITEREKQLRGFKLEERACGGVNRNSRLMGGYRTGVGNVVSRDGVVLKQVVEELCAQPDAKLMANVISFL